jgi:hypothetical protein
MNRETLKGLLGAAAFAVFGILTLAIDASWLGKAIGALLLVFGCFGVVAIVIGMMRGPTQESRFRFHTRIPGDIHVQCIPPSDNEFEEVWTHYSPTQPLLSVDAAKWREVSEYRWQVSVCLAEFVRDPLIEQILDPAIYDALRKTANVEDVQREDTEVWIVSGEPSGRELVMSVGAAIANCIPSVVPLLLKEKVVA